MSLDLKLAAIYLALAVLFIFMLGALWAMRRIINRAFASSGHDFYVSATGTEPNCPTCPFRGRCPYANSRVCKFTNRSTIIP